MDDSFAAMELQREASAGAVLGPVAGKTADRAAGESVAGRDLVAENRPHAFAAFVDVGLGRRFSCLRNPGETPLRIARQKTHEVEDVRAQDHEVLSAAAGIFFSSAAKLQDVAQTAFADQVADDLDAWAVPGLR